MAMADLPVRQTFGTASTLASTLLKAERLGVRRVGFGVRPTPEMRTAA
jgi:hypothetical protein